MCLREYTHVTFVCPVPRSFFVVLLVLLLLWLFLCKFCLNSSCLLNSYNFVCVCVCDCVCSLLNTFFGSCTAVIFAFLFGFSIKYFVVHDFVSLFFFANFSLFFLLLKNVINNFLFVLSFWFVFFSFFCFVSKQLR